MMNVTVSKINKLHRHKPFFRS